MEMDCFKIKLLKIRSGKHSAALGLRETFSCGQAELLQLSLTSAEWKFIHYMLFPPNLGVIFLPALVLAGAIPRDCPVPISVVLGTSQHIPNPSC